jgi:hypothetical protein
MRKKIVKLTVAVAMLTGSLGVGLAPRVASAVVCPPICCNASCTSIRTCIWVSGGCICKQFCQPNIPGGGLNCPVRDSTFKTGEPDLRRG